MKIAEHRDAYLKADAEGRMKILAKTYGLTADKLWKHKQSGKWIISHAGVQTIAAQEGIRVDYETVVASPEYCVVKATPYCGPAAHAANSVFQSTYGEASTENCRLPYRMPMAEKRGYDRGVLIATLQDVGGYGADFYGEDEADSFKKDADPRPEDGHGPKADPLPQRHTRKADLATEEPKKLSRAEIKQRMEGANRFKANLFDKMFDLEKEAFRQSWNDADTAGCASILESVESRVAKEG